MIRKFFHLFFKRLRISDPWNYKAPVLIVVPYFIILASDMAFIPALIAVAASFITILGIAGIGYFLNDLSDTEKDLAIGKENALADMHLLNRTLLFTFLLALALLPWICVFPLTPLTLALLGFEFLLFAMYSLPPFRLKERGFWGVLADALYAHANPILLAAFTFFLMGDHLYEDFIPFVFLLTAWQLVLGIRNILLHQLADHDNDIKSGTQTLVTRIGKTKAQKAIKWVLLPAEIFLFLCLAYLINKELIFFIPAILLFLFYVIFRLKILYKEKLPSDLREFAYTFLDDFYKEWMAIVILIALCLSFYGFLLILAFHCIAFKNAIFVFFRDIRNVVRGI